MGQRSDDRPELTAQGLKDAKQRAAEEGHPHDATYEGPDADDGMPKTPEEWASYYAAQDASMLADREGSSEPIEAEWERQYLWAIDKLRWALGVIRTWDMLNPPAGAPEPLSDGPFFRTMIDEVLSKTVPRVDIPEEPEPQPMAGNPMLWPCSCGRQQGRCPCFRAGAEAVNRNLSRPPGVNPPCPDCGHGDIDVCRAALILTMLDRPVPELAAHIRRMIAGLREEILKEKK